MVVEGAKCEELEKIVIDDDEEKFFQVGVQLPPWEKEELVVFLRKNVDVFAWSAYEALGVDSNFIYHQRFQEGADGTRIKANSLTYTWKAEMK